MKINIIPILFAMALLIASVVCQTPADITSSDSFKLKASVWNQEKKSPAIVLLHQCDADQSMYKNLAEILFRKKFHVITYDYRGLGKSVSADFDIKKSKNKREEWNKILKYNEDDLNAVMSFVKNKFKEKLNSISIFRASCGGLKVLYLAQNYKKEINAIGLFSSRISANIVREKMIGLQEKPALFITAKEEGRAFEAFLEGLKSSSSTDSKLIVYNGRLHAKALFEIDSKLENVIADWFVQAVK